MSSRFVSTLIGLSLLAGSALWPACRGASVSATVLPAPHEDDHPDGSPAELPRLLVELPSDTTATTIHLEHGDDLQAAIDKARPGDVIGLAPGAVFSGPIQLPKKDGASWITIRTASAAGALPTRGTRVSPTQAPAMAVIEAGAPWVIATDRGAHHYRIEGVEIRPTAGTALVNLVALGTDEARIEDVPHHIVIERCYIHGDSERGSRRGIALNSAHTAIVDSYLSDFKEEGADSQAIAGWNGPGPFSIINNYLEGAGENILFGGADPAVTNLVPADIVIRDNHIAKPLTWNAEHPSFAGVEWAVKNLLELKNARRVLIENNLLEHNWAHAQSGFAVLFTPRNQDGTAVWSMVRDVTFVRNIVRHSDNGVNVMGADDIHVSQQTKRIAIRHNLFDDIGGGTGRVFQILIGPSDLVIEHNTAVRAGDLIVAEGAPASGFVFRDNIAPSNVLGPGIPHAATTLATFFPGASFTNNALIGGDEIDFPPGNFFPASTTDLGFVDFAGGDYRLAPHSPFKRAASDGTDLGASFDASAPRPVRNRVVGR
ncbi:MAG TPA: hypothetical protein VF057_11380 [Thermoanaerobaculia bacterium]